MDTTVMLGHGSGGTMMKRIIDEVFFEAYAGEELRVGDDAARLEAPEGERVAFSTDSFVVTPQFFPGGDIGRLAVCGTVNDVATSGAVPQFLSCGFILEEGYPMDKLKRICASMAEMAKEAGVRIVTGDTKVVNRGHGDGVFINTAGVGVVPEGVSLGGEQCKPGDKVLVSGTLGDHGITEEMARNAAKLAGLDAAIQTLPNGYDTVCTDGMFSQGEWQLLSIARAAAADPAVLLLDEITANLDAETEARVLEALRRASEGRTVLSVSHRIYENLGGRTVEVRTQNA